MGVEIRYTCDRCEKSAELGENRIYIGWPHKVENEKLLCYSCMIEFREWLRGK